MFNNAKTKKRLTQFIIAFVVICMSITGSFMLLEDTIEEATAATVSVDVNSADTWRSAVNGRGSGDIVNIRLTGDVSASALLQAIPTGVTVNLNMNGKGIYWDTIATGTASIMDENYADGIRSDFWGLITNNGTLNITGTGTIRMQKVNYNYKTNGEKNNFATRSCAIVNNGTMTIGSGITVVNDTAMAANDQEGTNKFMDTFVYGCAIYNNSGTLTTSGKISSNVMAGGISVSGSNSYHYAFSYGIYGGKITTKGGSVSSEAKSGSLMATSSCKEENQVSSIATAIYGNGAQILGDTKITSRTSTWDSPGGYDCWSGGIDISISTGVMYTGSNYPVIGASVDIDSTFFCPGGSDFQAIVPGTQDYYTVKNKTGPSNYARRAYPIAGAVKVQNTIGDHTSEKNWSDGNFFGTPGSGSNNVENNFNMNGNMFYYPEEAYFGNTSLSGLAVNANGQFMRESGQNNNQTATGSFRSGVHGTTGTQFKVMYRYYDGEISASKLIEVSPKPITARNSQAIINVGGSANKTGAATAADATFTFGSGGDSVNSRYYELQSKTYEKVPTATFANRDYSNKSHWTNNATQFTGNVNMTTENTLVVYMNYVLKTPEAIRIVASNDTIYPTTTTKSFSVPYTGNAIVPGADFKLGIIGMGIGLSADTNDTSDDTIVTGRYNIAGNESSKIGVAYRYTTDQVEWKNGLPKDVGTYTIEVSVAEDTTFSSTSENRQAVTTTISATITKVDVEISGEGSRTVVYGGTYLEQIPFGEYKATGKGSDKLEGKFGFAGIQESAVPGAGQSTVFLTWTPTANTATANNYNATTFPVSLNVTKKPVTVNAGLSEVAYGNTKPTYTIEYLSDDGKGLADCDKNLMTEYLNNTVFVVKNDSGDYVRYNINEWAPAVGSYALRIETFGGADNENYTFSLNQKESTLTVKKRDIVYTATAIDRPYNGSDEVNVTLNYSSGNLTGDIYDSTISTVGTMPAGANAGEGKQVSVDVNSIIIKNSNNYRLVISNGEAITVNIAKATPTGVKVVAQPSEVVYDATATLEKNIALNVTESNIPGRWNWKQVDGVSPTPTVDVATYKAVFTPDDSVNYTTLEQDVALTVEQKEVKVSVKDPKTGADFSIQYGDAIPAISGSISYDGFTGKDDITNIGANGGVDATTTYTRGSSIGEYPVNVVSTLTSTNYYFTAVTGKITVVPRTLTVTVVNQNVTFGAPVPELNVSDLRFEGFYNTENYTDLGGTVVVTTTYTPGSSVGEYPVTASGYISANYNIVYVNGVLTVNKAVLTVVPNNVQGVQYGADAPDYTGNKLYSFVDAEGNKVTTSVTGDPVFTTQYKSGKDAGVYPVTVSVNNMTSTNYSFVGQEGTLTVGKADPKINDVPGATVVNTHKFSEATFDGQEVVVNPYNATMTVEGTFAFVDADRVATWGSDGMYDVVFTPADSHNYNVVSSTVANGGGVWLQILEKLVTGKPVIQGSAMAGSTLTLVLDSMDPAVKDYYNIEWYANDAKISGVTGLTYTLQTADIGKTFKVKLIPITSKGFTNGGTDIWSDPTSAVIEALLETTAAQFNAIFSDVEYDALSHKATVTLKDGYNPAYFGDITVKYNGLTSAPVNAGKYTVTVDVGVPEKPEGGYPSGIYYGPATGIVVGQFEITKATLNISIAVQDKIYDGSTNVNATVYAPIGLKDEMDDVRFAPGSKFSFTDPNVGQNKEIKVTSLALTGAQANNYQIDPTINVTAKILPRTIYFDAFGTDKVYDGTRGVNVTFRYNIDANEAAGAGYAAVDSATSVYPVNGTADAAEPDAGTRILENISCVLAGSSAKNYVAAFSNEGTAQVVIMQAEPVVELPVINGVTYNAQVTLGNLNTLLVPFETSEGSWIFKNSSVVPTVNQKKYVAVYTPKSKNYKAVEKEITVNVEPLSVTLWPEDTTITYGSKSPVIKIGPEVLPDGTLLSEIGGSCTPIHGYYAGASIGSYIVTLNNAYNDDNYAFTTIPGTLTVAPARLNVTATATDKVYDGTPDISVKFNVVGGKYGNDDVALNETSTIGQAATANAGPSTVTYIAPILVGSKAENYELYITPASGVLSVTISKADVSGVIFPVDAKVEFGYDLRYAEFAIDGIGDGTFAFENAKDIVPPAVDFYEYKVIFTPTDSRNYNTQERIVSLEVVKCVLDYIVGVAGTPQEGQTLSVVFTGLPAHAEPYIQYQWYRMSDNQVVAIPGATEQKYVATADDIGYTLVVVTYVDEAQAPFVYAEDAYEEGFGETDIRCIVGAANGEIKEISLTFWQRLINWLRRIIEALTGIQLGMGA
ncbi:MAG: hypothetical protein IKW03_07755 [Clostridia bacterium]|nr:hypothetical protein [Clostridia bacterium]